MEVLSALIASPLFAPLVMLVAFFATQWYNNRKAADSIKTLTKLLEKRLEKDEEQDRKIVVLEKDMVKVKAEQEGIASTLMAKIENLEELVKSLRDWIHNKS